MPHQAPIGHLWPESNACLARSGILDEPRSTCLICCDADVGGKLHERIITT
jgi:hypothetical protein